MTLFLDWLSFICDCLFVLELEKVQLQKRLYMVCHMLQVVRLIYKLTDKTSVCRSIHVDD